MFAVQSVDDTDRLHPDDCGWKCGSLTAEKSFPFVKARIVRTMMYGFTRLMREGSHECPYRECGARLADLRTGVRERRDPDDRANHHRWSDAVVFGRCDVSLRCGTEGALDERRARHAFHHDRSRRVRLLRRALRKPDGVRFPVPRLSALPESQRTCAVLFS